MSIVINEKEIKTCNECVFNERCRAGSNDDERCMWAVLHFIVKDYRHMYHKYHEYEPRIEKMKERIKKKDETIRKLVHSLREEDIKAMPEGEQKALLERMTNTIRILQESEDKYKKQIELLYAQIEDTKNTRNAVVEAVTDDLEEKLKVANQRIELLAKAVADPNAANSAFIQNCMVHNLETDEEKQWMVSAMHQLDKAARNLISVEEKLQQCDTILKNAQSSQEVDRMLKIVNRLSSKLEATLSHIECFFDKVGEIKVINND